MKALRQTTVNLSAMCVGKHEDIYIGPFGRRRRIGSDPEASLRGSSGYEILMASFLFHFCYINVFALLLYVNVTLSL